MFKRKERVTVRDIKIDKNEGIKKIETTTCDE
jgi:hypothetical protein